MVLHLFSSLDFGTESVFISVFSNNVQIHIISTEDQGNINWNPELRLARIAPRPNCASGVLCPFRFAQEGYFYKAKLLFAQVYLSFLFVFSKSHFLSTVLMQFFRASSLAYHCKHSLGIHYPGTHYCCNSSFEKRFRVEWSTWAQENNFSCCSPAGQKSIESSVGKSACAQDNYIRFWKNFSCSFGGQDSDFCSFDFTFFEDCEFIGYFQDFWDKRTKVSNHCNSVLRLYEVKDIYIRGREVFRLKVSKHIGKSIYSCNPYSCFKGIFREG